jgi:hypothetical protein
LIDLIDPLFFRSLLKCSITTDATLSLPLSVTFGGVVYATMTDRQWAFCLDMSHRAWLEHRSARGPVSEFAMTRFGLVSIVFVLSAGPVGAVDPAPAHAPKELLEKRLEAARNVFRQNLTRVKAAQAQPSDVFGWSERWLEAELALAAKPADRGKALRDHVERTREVERVAIALARTGQGRQADADAATYYRADAEIRLAEQEAPRPE